VDYLYSLYDALVSINVPNDKARAVVDAMERDMGTTLATKADMDNLRVATKADLDNLRVATKADLQSLSQTTKADLETVRLAMKVDLQSLSQTTKADLETVRLAMKADLESLRQTTTADIENLRLTTKAELQFLRLEMATKSDLAEVRQECAVIRKDIEILSGKMAALAKDITVRLGSTMLALVMLLFTALKLT